MTKIEDQARAKINYALWIGTSREYINTMWELLEMIGMIAPSYESSLPTQQDKVAVPEFVAEWYERNKDDLEQAIFDLHVDLYLKSHGERTEFEQWDAVGENRPTETLIRMKDGYTVEKEQLYWIYDPIADQYLGYDRVEEKAWWLLKQNNGARAELTDAEINKVGEQYRAFAVPVKVVEI